MVLWTLKKTPTPRQCCADGNRHARMKCFPPVTTILAHLTDGRFSAPFFPVATSRRLGRARDFSSGLIESRYRANSVYACRTGSCRKFPSSFGSVVSVLRLAIFRASDCNFWSPGMSDFARDSRDASRNRRGEPFTAMAHRSHAMDVQTGEAM